MYKKKPRTAEEALAHFNSILDDLPQAERDRLWFVGLAIGPNTEPADLYAEILGVIMNMPERERRCLLVAAIRAMHPKERCRWIRYFERHRPDMMGYVMVHVGLLDIMEKAIRGTLQFSAKDAQKLRELREKLQKRGVCAEVKKKKTASRNALIDQLIGAGEDPANAQKIFDFVREQDETLLYKSKKTKSKGLIDPKMMMKVYRNSKRRQE